MVPLLSMPIIAQDLSHEETILQIADALEHLESITDKVFDGLSKRIQEKQQELSGLTSRISLAQKKVEALKQSSKATCLYSSSKYPAKPYEDYKSAFTDLEKQEMVRKGHLKSKEKKRPFDSRDLNEKMTMYHIRPVKDQTYHSYTDYQPKSVPSSVTSASSFLIYNTAENPYQKFEYVNALEQGKVKGARKVNTEGEDKELEDAPASMRNDLDESIDEVDNYFYNPDIGDLPELDLPDNLDLMNIAQDFKFESDLGKGIAPSVNVNDDDDGFGDIPDITSGNFSADDTLDLMPASGSGLSLQRPQQQAQPEATFEMPPPPPPTAAPLPPIPSLHEQPPKPPAQKEQKPPTPKPQVKAAVVPDEPDASRNAGQEEKEQSSSGDTAMPAVEGGRASLMDAIRKAGGAGKAGLKSVKEKKAEEKKAKEDQKMKAAVSGGNSGGGGGGDLMSDLASKLSLRRKGISGSRANEGSKVGTMDKISLMIPPPPDAGKMESPGEEDSEDDWDA